MSHVYCPECGFQNPQAANYCARCGALLVKQELSESTIAFVPDEAAEEGGHELERLGVDGPALVVRSGGGRAGETFVLERERTTIGRSPDCDIFLDDVTVSRKHAVIEKSEGVHVLADLESLNGTFLNRSRIERALLSDGDELQIGKYKLSFLR